jgi:hypothetical protein
MQSFWYGQVTTMERLSVASFLAHGHEVHVYAYDELTGLPSGATVKDAAEVIPPRRRRRGGVYRDDRGSFSSYANMFRYKLLLERGGWWIDLDVVCLKPFEFDQEYVFATEPDRTIANAVFRVPPDSAVMAYVYRRCLELGNERKRWGTTGPRLLREGVEQLGLQGFAVDPAVFVPIDWPDWKRSLEPGREWRFAPETHSVHLWNSLWAKAGYDRDAAYPATSLYEALKRRYLS